MTPLLDRLEELAKAACEGETQHFVEMYGHELLKLIAVIRLQAEALEEAQNHLDRIWGADFEIEQARLAARSGVTCLCTAMAKCEEILCETR